MDNILIPGTDATDAAYSCDMRCRFAAVTQLYQTAINDSQLH